MNASHPSSSRTAPLPQGWADHGKKIRKTFVFKDFVAAFTFMTRCAFSIEKLNHHPEWLNVYNKVIVDLTTHDAGGVTAKDIELAGVMDKLAHELGAKG